METCLNDPRFEFAIQENIKSQDFKTRTAFVMVWKTCSVVVLQNRMSSDKGLDDHILCTQKRTQIREWHIVQIWF